MSLKKQIKCHDDILKNYFYVDLFKNTFPDDYNKDLPVDVFFAPGRINIIGEHIDYNGGMVLPAALSIGIYAILQKRNDGIISVVSDSFSKTGSFSIEAGNDDALEYKKEDGWISYVKGMISYLFKDDLYTVSLQGVNIFFISNLPDGAGLSSSAALEVLTGYIFLYNQEALNINRIHLAEIAMKMENEYIKVNCGIMDQFSVAMGAKDNAILLDTQTLKYEYIPFQLKNYSLVIAYTNKKRELSESKYNERQKECELAKNILHKVNDLEYLVEADEFSIEQLIDDPVIKKRALHVVTENERVVKAVKYMTEGDIIDLGKLLTESHDSLKNNYEVSGRELDIMVEESLKHPSCIGARMTGAGFGGCAIALVETKDVDDFIKSVSLEYEKQTNKKPDLFVSQADDGVRKIR